MAETICTGSVREFQLGCHPHLLEVLPPGDCILPLKIVPHLSNGMMLHFIVLILSTFSSHFQSS